MINYETTNLKISHIDVGCGSENRAAISFISCQLCSGWFLGPSTYTISWAFPTVYWLPCTSLNASWSHTFSSRGMHSAGTSKPLPLNKFIKGGSLSWMLTLIPQSTVITLRRRANCFDTILTINQGVTYVTIYHYTLFVVVLHYVCWTCFLPVSACLSRLLSWSFVLFLDISVLMSICGPRVLSYRHSCSVFCLRAVVPYKTVRCCGESTTEKELLTWGLHPVTLHYCRTSSCLPKYKPHLSV